MRTLSAAYLAAAKAAGRYPDLYAIIYGINDTLTISGKGAIISANITRGDTAKPAYFEVGRAISSSAVLTVDRRRIADETLIVSGAKIEIYAEFDTPAGAKIADVILATMYISGYDNQDKDIGYISAVDRLVYTGGDFNPDGLTYPVTLSDMLTEAFEQSGLSGVSVMLPVNPHVNSAPYEAEEPVADGMSGDPYTCRDVIGKIAGMQMSDLFMDADGQPKVYSYGSYITGAITDDLIYDLSVSAESFAVNQVIVYKSDKRMPKDDAHYQKLPYSPRFEDMDDISSGGAWWDEIVARAHVFVRTGWTTCRVTFAGVGELEPGDYVEIGSAGIPAFVSGIEYEFSSAAFRETVYSFAYTLEEYYQAPSKATVVSTDVKKTGGGVGEDIGNHSERFNDYTDNASAGEYDHIEGKNNIASDYSYCLHIGGELNRIKYGKWLTVHGYNNKVTGYAYYGALFGANNEIVSGSWLTVSGYDNKITNSNGSGVIGQHNILTNADSSWVSGEYNTVSGDYDVVTGYGNTVTTHYAFVGGQQNTVSGSWGLTVGQGNLNNTTNCGMFGQYGEASGSERLVVGDGSDTNNRSKAFYVLSDGTTYAKVYNTTGADYAEYFEWADGNPDGEDRRGMLVTFGGAKQKTYIHDDMYNEDIEILQSDKIVFANGDDILGAVSCRASVIGNAYEEHWHGKYKTDVFDAYIPDKDGKPQLSDDYDPERKYIPRSRRQEWTAVGLVGRLIIRDNGKCEPGGYVTARQGVGAPTFTETRARCIRRLDESHIEILVR